MTISDLTDYLAQFPPDTRVVLSDDDVSEPGEYVALDVLDYAESASVPHDFQRARFTGNLACLRCGLVPLDDDDFATPCE